MFYSDNLAHRLFRSFSFEILFTWLIDESSIELISKRNHDEPARLTTVPRVAG